MKRISFEKVVPPTSERFERAVASALTQIREEKNMTRKKKMGASLALALALAFVLAASALALTGQLGILELLRGEEAGVQPLSGAENHVQNHIALYESASWRVEVCEAMYVGNDILLLADVTVPTGRRTQGYFGMQSDVESAASDPLTIPKEDAAQGESYYVYQQMTVEDGAPDALELSFSIEEIVEAPEGELPVAALDYHFPLRRSQQTSLAHYRPDAEAVTANWEILGVRGSTTDVSALLTIEYAQRQQDGKSGPFYGTENGQFFHADANCRTMKGAALLEDTVGKEACPYCVIEAASLRFALIHADGEPINGDDYRDFGALIQEDGRMLRKQVFSVQPVEAWPKQFTLQVYETLPNGQETLAASIPCALEGDGGVGTALPAK